MERLQEIPALTLAGPEATYLAWIDASGLEVDNPPAFFEQAGVGLSAGADFGDSRFARLNFGCPRTVLDTVLFILNCLSRFRLPSRHTRRGAPAAASLTPSAAGHGAIAY